MVNLYDNSMCVYIAERNSYGYVYELSMRNGNDSTRVKVDSIKNLCSLARMMGIKQIIIESNVTLKYDVNGADLAAQIELEILTEGATRKGRKYNPEIHVTSVLGVE